MRECILIADDDATLCEGLALLLERPGRTIVTCRDIESADLALKHYPVTHLLTDVQFSGIFGFEGLHLLSHVRATHPRCRVVLMTGAASPELRSAASQAGATAVLQKPFDTNELEAALSMQADDDGAAVVVRVPSLDEFLAGESPISTAFQPIVSLDGGNAQVVAFEALLRTGDAWPMAGPRNLFEYASRRARLVELNLTALAHATAAATELPGEPLVFFNLDPTTFQHPTFAQSVERSLAAASLPAKRVVIEITERSSFGDTAAAYAAIGILRELGIRFALDDHGSAYSHLGSIEKIAPAFIKISQEFGTGFEADAAKRRIVTNLTGLARDFGCKLILEGIETAETALAATALGIDFGQGYFFGHPHAAGHWKSAA